MIEKEQPILLVGTGAMSSLFAAILSAKGLNVRMLGTWKENIEVLNEVGVRYIDPDGQESIYRVEATDDPKKCDGSRLAIVLVKSYQTESAAKRLVKCLADEGIAITLQNGLGNYQILADVVGAQRVISGVTTMGATLVGPGIVRMGGLGGISIGDHERADIPAETLRNAGLEVNIVPHADSLLWGKLVINASINPLTALLQVRNGMLLENQFARELMKSITIESARVASGLGIELPFSDPVETVEGIAKKTASNYSSMYIDMQRGGHTEIDAINGAIVRKGDEIGVSVDNNRVMWLLVKARTESHISSKDSSSPKHG